MPTTRNIILVALFLGTLIEESGENLSEQAECLRVCGLVREERSKTGVQVSRSLSCDKCLKRMKDRHTLTAKTFRRKRRSRLDTSNCVHWSDNESVPNLTIPSEVNVTFGQYENTNYWYANISWTPMNDFYGHLSGIELRLSLLDDDDFKCIVLSKNQTFFSINLSFYGYNYLDPIFLQVLGIPYRNQVIPMKGYLPDIPGSPSPTALTEATDCVHWTDDESVPDLTIPSEVNVTFGQYENTNYWYANISWIPMNDFFGHLNGIVLRLSLLNDDDFKCIVLPKNQTFFIINLSFYGYNYPEPIFLQVLGIPYRSQVIPIKGYLPDIPGSSSPTTLTEATDSRSEFEYHAFIIYSKEDSGWVITKLLPFLEEKRHLKCCIHYRDFMPGIPYHDSMADSVYKSYKIIAVLSSNFLNSNYCREELDLAKYRLLNRRDDSLIIIRIDKTDYKKLPRKLQKRNFIDYSNPLEKPFWQEKLVKFLDVPNDPNAILHQNNDNNNSDNDYVIQVNNSARFDCSQLTLIQD